MNKYQLEHRSNIMQWLGQESWDYFITIRPLKTRLTESNIVKFMSNIFKNEYIEKLFYVLETDWNRASSHSHIIMNTSGIVTREAFAKSIKRHAIKEVKYFEKVDNRIGVSKYVSKHIGNEHFVKSYDMLTKEHVLNSYIQDNYQAFHPNKAYHDKARMRADMFSGKKLQGNSYLTPKPKR